MVKIRVNILKYIVFTYKKHKFAFFELPCDPDGLSASLKSDR